MKIKKRKNAIMIQMIKMTKKGNLWRYLLIFKNRQLNKKITRNQRKRKKKNLKKRKRRIFISKY